MDEYLIHAEALTAEAFAPFGQILCTEPDEAIIGLRDREKWLLNILSYVHRPLVVDHLNAHHKATQALIPLGKPALLVVAPPGTVFASVADLAHLRAFVLDGSAGVNLGFGTWHWGPYPVLDHVHLVNLQGRGFADDNEVAHLARDLDSVVRVVLS